ncbi:MAG: hypothetical protein FJ279_27425 [Planctomycetes bacterium]|nr:hypothetical protein [Planctomycetota bacterium]
MGSMRIVAIMLILGYVAGVGWAQNKAGTKAAGKGDAMPRERDWFKGKAPNLGAFSTPSEMSMWSAPRQVGALWLRLPPERWNWAC